VPEVAASPVIVNNRVDNRRLDRYCRPMPPASRSRPGGAQRRRTTGGHTSGRRPLSPRDAALDPIFGALANQTRREIVARLARGPMTTPAIGRLFGFSRQALSRHVGLLEQAGLIQRVPLGRVHELAIVPRRLESVSSWVSTVRGGWESSLDRLDAVLEGRR
jgi:DNA-binding transcriptional ArsR family regulator